METNHGVRTFYLLPDRNCLFPYKKKPIQITNTFHLLGGGWWQAQTRALADMRALLSISRPLIWQVFLCNYTYAGLGTYSSPTYRLAMHHYFIPFHMTTSIHIWMGARRYSAPIGECRIRGRIHLRRPGVGAHESG